MSAVPHALSTPLELSLRNDTDLSLLVVQVAALDDGGLTLGPASKRLPLSDGKWVLAPRSQARISLPAGPQGIVLAEANSLFPVASAVCDAGGAGALQLNVGKEQIAAMGQALDLVRNLMAAPSSQLASDLNDGLQASLADPGTDADMILRGFFAEHPPFQQIDATQFGLVLSWARNYAYLWSMAADGSPSRHYRLHAAPYLGGDAPSLGRISFGVRTTGAIADPGDPACGLQIEWTPAGSSATQLRFGDSCFCDDAGLLLMGSFVAAGWLSAPSSTGLLPVLVGSLDGLRVIAVPGDSGCELTAAASDPVPPQSERGQSLDALDISNLTMSLIGLVSSLVTIVSAVIAVVGYYKAKRVRNEPIDARAVADAQSLAQLVGDAQRSELGEVLARMNQSLPMIKDIPGLIDQLRETIPETLKNVVREQLGQALSTLEQQVSELAAIEITNRLREVQGDLVEVRQSLNSDLPLATEQLAQAQQQIPAVVKEMGVQVSGQLNEQIETALEVTRETLKVSEQVQEDMEDIREGEEKVVEGKSPIEK